MIKQKILIHIFGLVVSCGAAWGGNIDPLINMMFDSKGLPARAMSFNSTANVTLAGTEPVLNVLIKTNNGVDKIAGIKGIKINSVVQNIVTASMPLSSIKELAALKGIEYIEASRKVKPNLDLSLVSANIVPIKNTYNYKGSGILVGVFDSGIDYLCKDFRNVDGTTRIKYIWDQTGTASGSFVSPAGFAYGVEYSQSAINTSISGGTHVPETDAEGHGTHVSGIAAGNGLATGNSKPAGVYAGVASEAEIVFVKANLQNSNVVDGVSYIMQKAAALGKPVVVNLSLGTQDGPHDGTSLFETAIDGLTAPGKIVVASAGNEGSAAGGKIHYSGTATLATSSITVSLVNNIQAYFTMWYKGGSNISVQVKTLGGTVYPASPVQAGSTYSTNTLEGFITIDASSNPNPLNGDNNVIIAVDDSAGPKVATGQWVIIVKGVSLAGGGAYDIWAPSSDYCSFLGYDNDKTLAAPGTCKKVITVGSYTTRTSWQAFDNRTYSISGEVVGTVSSFSSSGPTRDNRHKPEILAPGAMIASSISRDYSYDTRTIVTDDSHAVMGGTSMAAPHVTGLVALLLQKKKNLSVDEVRTALTSTAFRSSWDKKEGFGLINGVSAFLSITGAISSDVIAVTNPYPYPNPARGSYVNLAYTMNADCDTVINFYNLAGVKVSMAANHSTNGFNKYTYDVSKMAPGVYFCQITASGGAVKSKTIKVAIIK